MFARTLLTAALASLLLAGCNGATETSRPAVATPLEMEEAASARTDVAGRPAPDFTLQDQTGKPVSLADLRGRWVVLYFYPKDDTPGCACQATEFTQLLTEFERMDARVFGVSEDSPESHRSFIRKYNLKLDLLSDPAHDTMEDYGAWVGTPFGNRVIRTTYIIGPDGTIRHHFPEVIPEGHAQRVRDKVRELQGAQSR